jgi:NTP pyrophosphatase (non-canonical NTP hydrolase)
MQISELQNKVHSLAKAKGWWDNPNPNFPEKLALVHAELSEALEDYRNDLDINATTYNNGKPEGIPSELADVVIRVLDMCGYYGIDLEKIMIEKHQYNESRPFRHGGKKA